MKKQSNTIIVHQRYVSCDGGEGALGHPKIYLEIKEDTDEIFCPYCSRHFVYGELYTSPTFELREDSRPLAKLASGSQVQGAYGTEDRSVSGIHEDLSTGVTKQLAAEVGFPKRSSECP